MKEKSWKFNPADLKRLFSFNIDDLDTPNTTPLSEKQLW